MKKTFKHALFCIAALGACIGTVSAAEPQSCLQVKMADPGWTDIDATNAMAGVVLKALGYKQSVSNLFDALHARMRDGK